MTQFFCLIHNEDPTPNKWNAKGCQLPPDQGCDFLQVRCGSHGCDFRPDAVDGSCSNSEVSAHLRVLQIFVTLVGKTQYGGKSPVNLQIILG